MGQLPARDAAPIPDTSDDTGAQNVSDVLGGSRVSPLWEVLPCPLPASTVCPQLTGTSSPDTRQARERPQSTYEEEQGLGGSSPQHHRWGTGNR